MMTNSLPDTRPAKLSPVRKLMGWRAKTFLEKVQGALEEEDQIAITSAREEQLARAVRLETAAQDFTRTVASLALFLPSVAVWIADGGGVSPVFFTALAGLVGFFGFFLPFLDQGSERAAAAILRDRLETPST